MVLPHASLVTRVIAAIAAAALGAATPSAAQPRPAPACERLIAHAHARYDARDDFAAAADAAARARRCLGGIRPTDGLALLSIEARARFNADDWRGGAALSDTLAPLSPSPARADYAVALAHAGLARVYLGRGSEGLADIGRGLRLAPESSPRERASVLAAQVLATERLADFASTDRALADLAAFVAARVPEPHRTPQLLRALSDRASNLVLWHEHGGLPNAPRRLADALASARRADMLATRIGDTDSRAIARQLTGDALHSLGRLDEAEAALRPLVRGAYGDFARWSLARIATRRGRFDDAARHYRDALRDAASHPDAHELLYELGCALESAGRDADAEAAFRQAIAALDAFTAATGADEAWVREREVLQRPHRALARLLARTGRPADALVALDASRARLLAAARDRAQGLARDTPDGRRLASVLDALTDARDRRTLAFEAGDARDVDRLDAEIERLRARLAAASPLPPLAPLDVPRLQRRLRDDRRALVAYLIDTPDAAFARETGSFAFVVTADTVAAIPLDTLGIGADLARVATADGRGLHVGTLARLYDRLVRPTWAVWNGAPRLTVVPDGALFALPFAALASRGNGFDYRHARFLIDEVAVSTESAAGLLLTPRAPASPPGAVFAVVAGRGDFERRAPSGGRHVTPGRGGARTLLPDLPDLPGVARELRSVRARLPRVHVLADRQATESALLVALRGARVLHIATHAVAGDALTAAFHVSPGGGDDGLLRLHELQAHALPLDLAVLSGCETARGDLVAGEGMQGLLSGMRSAGTRSVVAMLWRVPDGPTGRLMTVFYDALGRGLRRDEALREAQITVRRRHPDPAVWAAPVLYGDAHPMTLPSRRAAQGPLLLLALALALAAAAAVASRRSRSHR